MTAPAGFRCIEHEVDFCVVGGGMAGLAAAIAAARQGMSVALMHDRPVLGGNASSECRIHICGADIHNTNKNMRETGILEEIRLDNLRRNAGRNFSVWDTILYEKARYQPNLELLLNCSCLDAEMDGAAIRSVTGWQLTTQTRHRVRAKVFADCSGDGVLAPLTGALCRMGREGRSEYGESIAPVQADNRTMGMTCLFAAKRLAAPQPFEPPAWAYAFDDCGQLPSGHGSHGWLEMGYWWIELGGEHDAIANTETLRDELLKITYGVWDHIKNRCPDRQQAENWTLDWLQFLPAKRESRRYVGDHVLCQSDIEAAGRFDDRVAYGGWSMDDHHPAGFWATKVPAPPTIFHPAPSPYGIPYCSLYSRNVANLMFAGRDASCTHAAMSSTRVMGTGCSMGQAVGTAAAMAVRLGVPPREIAGRMDELQQALLRDDAYLPWVGQKFSPLTMSARLSASQGDPSPLRDGVNRPVGADPHAWVHAVGDWVELRFDRPEKVGQATLILDSALERLIALSFHQPDDQLSSPPGVLQRAFHIEALSGGKWSTVAAATDNHQRLVRLAIDRPAEALRYVLEGTWGEQPSKLFAFYVV
jgi:hypothetical protein